MPRTRWSSACPATIDEILAIAKGARTPEQTQTTADLVPAREQGPARTKELALQQAQQPRASIPAITERETKLAAVSEPLPKDPGLARLERAVSLSEEQLKNVRLTTAQDLAWALINSPAFLFNR